jgi:hypothetical protein
MFKILKEQETKINEEQLKLTKEEIKQFEEWKDADDVTLEGIREQLYQLASILYKSYNNE